VGKERLTSGGQNFKRQYLENHWFDFDDSFLWFILLCYNIYQKQFFWCFRDPIRVPRFRSQILTGPYQVPDISLKNPDQNH